MDPADRVSGENPVASEVTEGKASNAEFTKEEAKADKIGRHILHQDSDKKLNQSD